MAGFGGFGGGIGFGAAGGFGGAAAGGFGAAPAAVGGETARDPSDFQVQLQAGTDTISAVAFSPSGQHLAFSSWDGKVSVYELHGAQGPNGMVIQGATPRAQSPDLQAPVLDIKWAADGSSIYAVGCNKKAVLWNLATSAVTELGAHDAPIKSCHWCPSLNALATGGWDSTLRYWDGRAPREIAKVALPGKLNTMDVRDASMVLGTSDKKFHVFNLATPDRPLRSLDSPLKHQTRCMRICADGKFYLAASSEGRCAIRALDTTLDSASIPGVHPPKTYAFAFKCHRDESLIYPVNAVDAHPRPEHHNVFSTAGGDGVVSFWDREKRHRVREMKVSASYGQNAQVPVTDARWSPDGKCFAYAMGYDWSKGGEHYDPAKMPPQLWVHGVVDKDLKK